MEENAWKVLTLTAKRGHIGATREDFFREIRGIAYVELEEAIQQLEAEGYIQVEYSGVDKFLVTITEKGGEMTRGEYEKRLATYKARMEEQQSKGSLGKL